jgi:hypothetical protein
VYFVKTAPARLDNDNIKTHVGLVVSWFMAPTKLVLMAVKA